MVEGPADVILKIEAETQKAMAEASAVILDGFRLSSNVEIIRWPDRYLDEFRQVKRSARDDPSTHSGDG